MQGPITVFDANAYAGDARMEDLAPGQERLISYALDIKTEVEPQAKDGPRELVAVKIRTGTLLTTKRIAEDKIYLVRNRDQKKKAVLVEHPFRSDWQLVEPKEATERTREVYRFLVNVDPDKTEKLTVREQKQLDERLELVNSGSDVIAYYLKAKEVSPKVKSALEKVVSLRDTLNKMTAEKNRREQRVNEITQEQTRIRENMTRLNQSSDLYTRYVRKLDQQETELENLRKETEGLKDQEAKQQRDLNDYLLNLEVE
jgi:myosin heavy subunit